MTNQSFLFSLPAKMYFTRQMNEVTEELAQRMDIGYLAYYLQEIMIFKHRYSLNAVTPLEYFARIARCEESTRQNILSLSKRATGDFVYRKTDKKYHHFEHWVTGVKFEVLIDSMDDEIRRTKPGERAKMELVFWNQEWWLSGMVIGGGEESDEKPSWQELDYSFYTNNKATQERLMEQTRIAHEVFLDTFGDFIYYAIDGQDFVSAYTLLQRKVLAAYQLEAEKKLTTEEIDQSIARMTQSVQANMEDYEDGVAMASFEKEGLSFVISYGEAVEYLEKDHLDQEESEELYDMLIVNYKPEISEYLIHNYPTHNLVLPVLGREKLDAVKYWKFLHRFTNPETYDEHLPLMKSIEQVKEDS